MISKLNQNILFTCTSVLFLSVFLMCQPLIETCLKFDDTVSFVELDVDIENEVKDKSLQEFEKVSSLRKVFSIESIDRESSLNSANICIKYYWINQSQDILTHPPKLIS